MDREAKQVKHSVHLSPVMEAGGTIYVSGHIPVDNARRFVEGDIGTQTRRVLEIITELLKAEGVSKDDIVKMTVYLVHVKRDFVGMNEAYGAFFGDHRPARTTVGVELAVDVLVEIDAVAVRKPVV